MSDPGPVKSGMSESQPSPIELKYWDTAELRFWVLTPPDVTTTKDVKIYKLRF